MPTMMRNLTLLVLLGLAATSAGAQNAPVRITVGGKHIEASVIETNGTIYVPLDAIARVLGVEVTIQTNVAQQVRPAPAQPPLPATEPKVSITLTPPKPQTPTTIKGRLTYHKNMYQRNEPDPGAQVWLLTEEKVYALAAAAGGTVMEPIPERATGWETKFDSPYTFPKAVADGHGDFMFQNIPAGTYTLIMFSKRANGLAARDRTAKMRFKRITVGEGETVDASFNFGMTAYRTVPGA
jgi:hypothetical protein